MKNILVFFFSIVVISLFAGANDRTRPTISVESFNQPTDKNYVSIGNTAADTVVVSDTLNYVFSIAHSKIVVPYFTNTLTKIGAGTATITVNFFQSNDGTNYNAVKKGKLQSAYTKSISLTATANNEWNFALDTVQIEGRFLKIQYITSSTANVKFKVAGKGKFNIK